MEKRLQQYFLLKQEQRFKNPPFLCDESQNSFIQKECASIPIQIDTHSLIFHY